MIVILLSNIPTFQHTVAAQDTIPPATAPSGARRLMRFSTGTVEIQVLPLDEQVIRCSHRTPTARSPGWCRADRCIADAAGRGATQNPTLVMVTFLAWCRRRDSSGELFITSRAGCSPIGIVPCRDVELIPARRAAAGRGDLPVRAGHQRPRAADGQLSGLSSDAWSGSLRVLDQERAPSRRARNWKRNPILEDVVHRTRAESAQTTLISA